jgi:hypothetical protein
LAGYCDRHRRRRKTVAAALKSRQRGAGQLPDGIANPVEAFTEDLTEALTQALLRLLTQLLAQA